MKIKSEYRVACSDPSPAESVTGSILHKLHTDECLVESTATMANNRDRTIAYFRHICTLAVATAAFTLTLATGAPNRSFIREDLLQLGMFAVIISALAGFIVQTLCVFFNPSWGRFQIGYVGGIIGLVSASCLVYGIWTLMGFVLVNLPQESQHGSHFESQQQSVMDEVQSP